MNSRFAAAVWLGIGAVSVGLPNLRAGDVESFNDVDYTVARIFGFGLFRGKNR